MLKKGKKNKYRSVQDVQSKVAKELAELKGESPIDLPDEQTRKRIAQEIQRQNELEAQKRAKQAEAIRQEQEKKSRQEKQKLESLNKNQQTENQETVKPKREPASDSSEYSKEYSKTVQGQKTPQPPLTPYEKKQQQKPQKKKPFWQNIFPDQAKKNKSTSKQHKPEAPDLNETNSGTQKPKPVNKIYGDAEPAPLYVPTYRRPKQDRHSHKSDKYRILPLGSKPIDYLIHLPTVLKRLFVDLRDPIPLLDKLLFFAVFVAAYFITVISLVLHYKFIEPDARYIIDVSGQQVEIIIKKEDIPDLKKTLGPNWLQKLGRRHLGRGSDS